MTDRRKAVPPAGMPRNVLKAVLLLFGAIALFPGLPFVWLLNRIIFETDTASIVYLVILLALFFAFLRLVRSVAAGRSWAGPFIMFWAFAAMVIGVAFLPASAAFGGVMVGHAALVMCAFFLLLTRGAQLWFQSRAGNNAGAQPVKSKRF